MIQEFDWTASLNLNVAIFDVSSGSVKIWNKSTKIFEAYSAGSIANYGIGAVEAPTATYKWTIPAELPPTPPGFKYIAKMYVTSTTSLATGDLAVPKARKEFVWSGTGIVEAPVSGYAGSANRRVWYVRSTGGSDTANNGLDSATPFATLTKANSVSQTGDVIDVDQTTAGLVTDYSNIKAQIRILS